MASQQQLDQCYMEVARAHAKLSKGVRGKIGACLVTKHGVILGGCNGLAPNGSNVLETKKYMETGAGAWLDPDWIVEQYPFQDMDGRYQLVTKPETIHAELSCILRAAKEGVSVVDSTLYVTQNCCPVCSEMVVAAGVTRVVYEKEYRITSGIQNLSEHGILVEKFNGSGA